MYEKSCGKNVLCIAFSLVFVIVEYKLSELFCTFVGFSLLLVTTFISKILQFENIDGARWILFL